MSKPVFILSSGRCGSTLLQRLINSNPRFAICGEHGGFLRPLAQTYQTLTADKQVQSYIHEKGNDRAAFLKSIRVSNSFTAWDNFFQRDDVITQMRALIRGLLQADETLRWGFKEVRYTGLDVLPMLRDLFPEAQYLFLVRHPLDVITSRATSFLRPIGTRAVAGEVQARQRYTKGILDSLNGWQRLYETLFAVAKDMPGQSLTVRYEELSAADPALIKSLEQFLGEGRFNVGDVLRHKIDPAERGGALESLAASILLENWDHVVACVGETATEAGYTLSRQSLEAVASRPD